MDDDKPQADDADEQLHQTIVEYVGSDPTHSGGCLGLVLLIVSVAVFAFFFSPAIT